MQDNAIKKIALKNGLTLEFIDNSRKIAGDRYVVVLKTRIEVPVSNSWFSERDASIPSIEDITKKVGDTVFFEQKKERNFVDENEKEAVLNNIIEVAEDFGIRYLGHPDFPKKLILKKYNEKK
ncbi:MAG: hypothetical protein DRP51_05810 [Candidatus Zixiibacteriota bacterium]|nr:MAG: hypothetical protein DRP51_05810 [candidate division Zixibacteria bacterium]